MNSPLASIVPRLAISDGRKAPAWYLIPVFGLSFATLFFTMERGVGPYQEGLILFGAMRVFSGDTPYRDFYTNYGPAQYGVLAGLFKVFGPSILVGRIWDLLVRAASATLVCAIFTRLDAPRMAVVATALSVVWLSAFNTYYGYPVFPCVLLALLSIYCVLPSHSRNAGSQHFLPPVHALRCDVVRHDIGLMAALAHISTLDPSPVSETDPIQGRRVGAAVRNCCRSLAGSSWWQSGVDARHCDRFPRRRSFAISSSCRWRPTSRCDRSRCPRSPSWPRTWFNAGGNT